LIAYVIPFFALTDDLVALLKAIKDKKKVEARLTAYLNAFRSGITGDCVSGMITLFSSYDHGQRWQLNP